MVLGDPAKDFAHLADLGAPFLRDVYDHYRGEKDPGLLRRAGLFRWLGKVSWLAGRAEENDTEQWDYAYQDFQAATAAVL